MQIPGYPVTVAGFPKHITVVPGLLWAIHCHIVTYRFRRSRLIDKATLENLCTLYDLR